MNNVRKLSSQIDKTSTQSSLFINSTTVAITSISNSLIEQNIPMIRVTRILLGRTKEGLHSRFIDHFHILIIEEQPVVVTFHKAHIVSMVGPTANMDNHSK